MKTKLPLFIGIIFLTIGVILKKATNLDIVSLSLIMIGVVFKIYYIINKVKTGEYKPGYELLFLIVGLIIFFIGLYFKKQTNPSFNPLILIITGVSLKIIFIILFIIKSRKKIS